MVSSSAPVLWNVEEQVERRAMDCRDALAVLVDLQAHFSRPRNLLPIQMFILKSGTAATIACVVNRH